jgi:hypothetical protein
MARATVRAYGKVRACCLTAVYWNWSWLKASGRAEKGLNLFQTRTRDLATGKEGPESLKFICFSARPSPMDLPHGSRL